MRFVSTLTALALAGSTLAQSLPRPGWNSPDPVTAVLTLTPKKGMNQQVSLRRTTRIPLSISSSWT
jgi:hypothetical protein